MFHSPKLTLETNPSIQVSQSHYGLSNCLLSYCSSTATLLGHYVAKGMLLKQNMVYLTRRYQKQSWPRITWVPVKKQKMKILN